MRLEEIETIIVLQKQAIKDLNDVLCEQLQEIERLGSICDALVKRVKKLSKFSPGINAPANEKPPRF